MPTLLRIIILFIASLIAGAIIAYPMYLLLANWFEIDFESVASRCVSLIAVVLFVALFRRLGINSWHQIGFNNNLINFVKNSLKGLLLGIIIMAPVIIGLLLTKNRIMDLSWVWSINNVLTLLITALLAGLVIALIEETLFRGIILTSILNQSGVIFAVISTNVIYAFVHFLEPEFHQQTSSINWLSGFELIKTAFNPWLSPLEFVDSFLALFMAGVLLSILKIKSNCLAICIGVHASWVLVIKFLKRVTHSNSASDYAYLTGSYDNVIGYFAAVCLAGFIVYFLYRRPFKFLD